MGALHEDNWLADCRFHNFNFPQNRDIFQTTLIHASGCFFNVQLIITSFCTSRCLRGAGTSYLPLTPSDFQLPIFFLALFDIRFTSICDQYDCAAYRSLQSW
jgi:hypothetical protein